jgi:hypothetical protein
VAGKINKITNKSTNKLIVLFNVSYIIPAYV